MTRDAWAEFLSRYQWDVFATLTYAGRVWCDEKIIKNVEHWLYHWQVETAKERCLCVSKSSQRTDGYGRVIGTRTKLSGTWWNSYRKGKASPIYVVGIEPHESGSLHAHAIIKWSEKLPDLRRRIGWRLWFESRANGGFGHGFARLEAPKSQDDVSSYVSKYVVKGGDLYLSSSFNAARLAAA